MRHLTSIILIVFGCVGCATDALLVRGEQGAQLVSALSTHPSDTEQYTLRWLRNNATDSRSGIRFDAVVVDLLARSLNVVRRADGSHVLLLHTEPLADGEGLHMPAQDLASLQAVVRNYHFEPYVIVNDIGAPEVIIFAPVPTRIVHNAGSNEQPARLEIYLGTNQGSATTGTIHGGSTTTQ